MNKFPLLIEIGCEDLPPDAMAMIEATAESNFSRLLKEKRIAHGKVTGFVTPRRIAVLAEGVGSKQDPVREKIKGPPRAIAEKNGVPTKAGLGFAQKVGVEYGELQIEKTPRGDYLSCIRQIEGENIRDIMSDILESFVTSFHFPITMRWPGGGVRFPRPIRWFIVRLGAKNVSCSLGQMKNARSTRGHYLFADKNIVIKDIAEYEQVLKQNYVLADPRKRREYLRKSIDRALKYTAGQPVITEELLGEVSSLLEYPTGIRGEFSEKYLKLPREVIEACLMYHQKYFPVEDEKGNLMNYFVGVRDGISEHLKSIKKGYEKVLIARLEDAEFFLKQDRCHPLEYYSEQLAGIEFTRGLGTLIDKVQRCNVTAAGFSRQLDKNDDFINTVQRISKLGKADLVTRMVGEFPELEGKVGRIYAKMDGEGNKVSNGIYQHYMPRTFEDNVPKIDEAAMVGVADRMDTLVGNYGAGVEATGSQDPFGMRRACRGLIRILVEKKWDLDLEELAKNSREQYKKQTDIEFSDDKRDICA